MEQEHSPFRSWSSDKVGACTWSPHKYTSHKESPIKPTQRSCKKTQQIELPMVLDQRKKNDECKVPMAIDV
jgi:hypothetical protein